MQKMTTYAKDKLDGLRYKRVSVEDFRVAAEDSNGDCQEDSYTLVKHRQIVPRAAFDGNHVLFCLVERLCLKNNNDDENS
jgi:hypothetical protein